ncbi:MAG: hypothetical protein Fur0014_02220 [Rubrivivax sp.]
MPPIRLRLAAVLARLTAGPLPEPGALEMLAAALGIGVFLAARDRRQG